MEVFSVLSSDDSLIEELVDKFCSEKRIKLVSKDDDTIYFEDSMGVSAFYLHTESDFEEEVKFEFDEEEEKFIRLFFKNEVVYMLDISYRDSTFLYQLLSDFTKDLRSNYKEKFIPLLFHDPFNGFVELEGIGR